MAFGKLACFASTLKKGSHVAIGGELRSREYDREIVVGTEKAIITQRVWEIRVDSTLKLDRAARVMNQQTFQRLSRSNGRQGGGLRPPLSDVTTSFTSSVVDWDHYGLATASVEIPWLPIRRKGIQDRQRKDFLVQRAKQRRLGARTICDTGECTSWEQ